MKIKIIALVLFATTFATKYVFAQEQTNYHIRQYNHSMALELQAQLVSKTFLSEYGKILLKEKVTQTPARYLYQGQEYDTDLNLHLFPSRIYLPQNYRFAQPDASSQYFSSYLFVNADPINNIDFDGNTGKPIVFFGGDRMHGSSVSPGTADHIIGSKNDIIPVSMENFLTGNVGDLSEWNGNVFIEAHMSASGNSLEVNRSFVEKDLHIKAPVQISKGRLPDGRVAFSSSIDSNEFGRILRDFSETKGIPVKNITAGGCQGSATAEKIGQSFTESGGVTHGRILTTRGLREGAYSSYVGNNVSENYGERVGIDHTRFYVSPSDKLPDVETEHLATPVRGKTEKFRTLSTKNSSGAKYDLPYTEGRGLQNLRNGRVPQDMAYEFGTPKHFLY